MLTLAGRQLHTVTLNSTPPYSALTTSSAAMRRSVVATHRTIPGFGCTLPKPTVVIASAQARGVGLSLESHRAIGMAPAYSQLPNASRLS